MKFSRRLLPILTLFVLGTACCFAGNESGKATMPAARIDLFNGKDLTGWTFCMRNNANPSNTWNAADGLIKCTGKPNGYIRTEQSYRDYKLTTEWRFVKIGPKE